MPPPAIHLPKCSYFHKLLPPPTLHLPKYSWFTNSCYRKRSTSPSVPGPSGSAVHFSPRRSPATIPRSSPASSAHYCLLPTPANAWSLVPNCRRTHVSPGSVAVCVVVGWCSGCRFVVSLRGFSGVAEGDTSSHLPQWRAPNSWHGSVPAGEHLGQNW